MLAETEHLNVFDDDHFVVADREEGTFKQGFGVFLVALGQKLHGFCDALGGRGQTFACRIFPEADDHFAYKIFESCAGQRRGFFRVFKWGWFHKDLVSV